MRDNIPDALITAFERQYDSSWNDPQLRKERLAMRYGWAAAMEAKQCLYQIQEPTVNHQLTIEREAFGIPQCPFPCGWKNLHTLLVAEGAFLARSLQEDEPITDHQRATVMRVVNYGLEMARAALAATPAEKSNSVEFGGIKTAAPVVLPEPDDSEFEQQLPIQPIGVMGGGEARKVLWNCTFMPEAGTSFYTEQQVRALLATGGQAQAVEQAPILYVSKGQLDNHSDPDGPDSANAGRYLPCRITPAGKFTTPLFAAPQAQAVEVDDHMALAFHHAITDGAIGQDDLNEIKIGLRAVLANLHAPQAQADARDAGLGTARAFIEWVKAQPEDREQTTIDGALVEFEAHIAAIAAAKGE